MTPPSPPSIRAYFAKNTPVCVLVKYGPRRYSQMILWDTATDLFEPGQWVRGAVQLFTMTGDGKYAAMGIMGAKPRDPSFRDTQISVVCRPPYFTALEICIGGLCVSGTFFLPGDRLMVWGSEHKIYAPNECPFERVNPEDEWPPPHEHDDVIDARGHPATGVDQRGREILIDKGRIYELKGGEPGLLFDGSALSFEEVVAPEWARQW